LKTSGEILQLVGSFLPTFLCIWD